MANAQTSDKQQTPGDRLKGEFKNLLGAFGERAVESVRDRVGETAGRLTDYAENGGGPGLMAAATGVKDLTEGKSPARSMLGAGASGAKEKVKQLFGGGGKKGGGGQGKKLKVTNIVEYTDVGVPARVAYNQWTQFRDFPSFMKKVESAEQESDEKINWRAQIFWSHRNWESTILKQIPDEMIVWRSKGEKGYVDGAVTFHELAPSLTRILLVLEYNPKGFFEQTGNLWRAQGRRARLELKHFRRHIMTQTILNPDDVEGWRGVIEDSEVVKDHETALREEQEEQGEESGDQGEPDEEEAGYEEPGEEEPEPAGAEDEAADEEAEPADEEAEPADEEAEPADEEPADEEAEPADEEAEYEPADEEAEPADEEAEYEPEEETEPAGTGESEERRDGEAARRERPRRSPPVTRRSSGSPVRRRRASASGRS